MNFDADTDNPHFPLADAIDHEILMHRDAHFGGDFEVMLGYYRSEAKGVQPEFTIAKIEQLAALEKEVKQNLSVLFLSAPEMEKVAESRDFYRKLKSIYEMKKDTSSLPKIIGDLILAEEEEPKREIEAVVAEKEKIVPVLIDILRNENLYDPLFPGYGLAPSLATECLGLIGDKRAIISLFESLGEGDFFADDQILKALKTIGEPAKVFLLRVLQGRPLNMDNEKAAIALTPFKDEEGVAPTALHLLETLDWDEDFSLCAYLIFICAGLTDKKDRLVFEKIWARGTNPSPLREDMQSVLREWKQESPQ